MPRDPERLSREPVSLPSPAKIAETWGHMKRKTKAIFLIAGVGLGVLGYGLLSNSASIVPNQFKDFNNLQGKVQILSREDLAKQAFKELEEFADNNHQEQKHPNDRLKLYRRSFEWAPLITDTTVYTK